MEHHAAGDAPADGGRFVEPEIDGGDAAQEVQDAGEMLFFVGRRRSGLDDPQQRIAELGGKLGELVRQHAGGQDAVDVIIRNAAARHLGELRRFRALHHGDAALARNGLEPEGAVGIGPGEDHAERSRLLVRAERTEEVIDRPGNALQRPVFEPEDAVFQPRMRPRRQDVDLVRLGRDTVADFEHTHLRDARDDLDEVALVIGLQVRNHDERHSRIGGQGTEQLDICLHPARGGADSDDGIGERNAVGVVGGVGGDDGAGGLVARGLRGQGREDSPRRSIDP